MRPISRTGRGQGPREGFPGSLGLDEMMVAHRNEDFVAPLLRLNRLIR
jgi:hypothetical protein